MKNALALSALLLASAAATPAFARDVAGVDVTDTVSAEGKTLKLNGAGVRKKFIIKVYVGALYVEQTATAADAIIKADAVKQVRMTFLRGVDKDKILGAYKEGFEKNSKDKMAELQAGLDKLGGAIKDMEKGGEMTVTYVPGQGTTIKQPAGSVTVEGKTFADALFRNWLGSDPADKGLRDDMLAGK